MKKHLFLLLSVFVCTFEVFAADCLNGPYSLAVNNTITASFVDAGTSPDGLPQLHAVASLQAGDKVQFVNTSCDARWFPQTVETGGDVDGSGNFTIEAGTQVTCKVAGCYNFWWKQKENDDRVYIGTDGNCSAGSENDGDCQDGPYAAVVNGATVGKFVDGGFAPDGVTPQLNISVNLAAGDVLQIENTSCGEFFFPSEVETGGDVDGSANFTIADGKATCKVAGCYNLWWKKIYGADKIYIGTDGNCSGNTGGDTGGGETSDCQDGPYGIQVNGTDVYNAQATGEVDFQGRTQYVAHVRLEEGDICKLINTSCGATWMVDLDPYDEYVNFEGGKAAGQIKCKKAGCYDFYIKLMMNDDLLYIGAGTECGKEDGDNKSGTGTKGSYGTAVPSQCTDVLLQGFYYDSYTSKTYNGTKFNDTKWASLLKEAAELGTYFDMVWLPPSAKSSGGTGYHPSQFSNQTSAWGSRSELDALIAAFHNSTRKTKVIADIVVNHMDNKSSWCDFWEQDFGTYGKFQPLASWITANDEMATASDAGSCRGKQGSRYDDGYGDEANYAAARDLAHDDPTVQNFVIAYLKWMYNVMDYDGWRYDYCKGFNNWHVSNYNKQSGAYFSVMEYWDGNVDVLRSRLSDAQMNTLTFDFATKYEAFNRGIAAGNYAGCKGSGLLGAGLSKYAVTFVDSHDSFQRDDNEMCGKNKSLNSSNKDKVLQANAFILSMPGVPCVFYPHYQVFKSEIQKMIMARHAAQVHSESSVSDEASSSGYKATITGKNGGSIVLYLGSYATGGTPSGYTLATKGNGYAVYYKAASNGTSDALTLTVTPGSSTFKNNTTGINVTVKTVALNGTATVYYTTDGTEPTTSSTKLTGTTLNFKQTTTLKIMAVAGSAKTAVQTYTYTYKEPQTTPIKISFNSNGQWDKVYLYTWGGADMGSWPGKLLTPDEDGWASYTFAETVKSISFIFNCGNGCAQTTDLVTDEDVCYEWVNGTEKLVENCTKEVSGINEMGATTAISVYPNPVEDVLNITSENALKQVWVYSLTGQVQLTEFGTPNQVNVSGLGSGMYLLRTENWQGEQTTQLFIKQ